MIDDFFNKITFYLSTSDFVEKFSIKKRKIIRSDGYFKIQALLLNGDFMEVSLYCQIKNLNIKIIDYRIHWQNKNGDLIKRWDNCAHNKETKNFPHHVHVNIDNVLSIESGKEIDFFEILQEIERNIPKKTTTL